MKSVGSFNACVPADCPAERNEDITLNLKISYSLEDGRCILVPINAQTGSLGMREHWCMWIFLS